MTPSVAVSHLSKSFEIGNIARTHNLREMLVDFARDPLRRRGARSQTFWALQDVSFTVQPGEIVGIIGHNGAGKSTLLKILSKISYPTAGAVTITGNVSALLEVGTGFSGELTGRENIYLAGSILGMSKRRIDSQFDSIVQFAGVSQFLDTPIKRFSSGMTLRLGFAVAAHLEADVLLVDEVLAVGDADFQKKCIATMSSLHRGRRTVLFVSHNLAAVENLCSRAIWIDHGQIRQDGDPKQVICAYLTTSSAGRGGDVDLRHVHPRRGSGNIRFTRLEFMDKARIPVRMIRSGDSLVARLHYEVTQRVEGPIFGLQIYSQLGTLISQVHTYNDGFDIPFVAPGSGCIEVLIRDVNLVPGQYGCSVFAANLRNLYHDAIDNCALLEVEPSGRYGLNRGLTHNPIMCLASSWRMPSSQSTETLLTEPQSPPDPVEPDRRRVVMHETIQ